MKPGPITFEDEEDYLEENIFGFDTRTIFQNDESLTGDWIKSPSDIFQGFYSDSILIEDEGGKTKETGAIAALIKNMNILWIKKFENIESMKIIDDGTSILSHYNFIDFSKNTKPIPGKNLGGTIDVFDNQGNVIFSRVFTSNIGTVDISYNGKYVLASTLSPDSSIYCYDISQKKQIWKYENQGRRQVMDIKLINNKIEVYCGRSSAEKELAYHLDMNGKLDELEAKRQDKIESIKTKTNTDEKIKYFLSLLNTNNTQSIVQVFHEIQPLITKTKKMHSKILDEVLSVLDPSNEEIFHQGWAKKPEIFDEFADTVLKILKMPSMKMSSRIFYYQHIALFNPKSLESEIPYLLNIVKYGEDWNDRRFAISVAGILGSKNPDLVKEFVPILINYIKSDDEIEKLKQMTKDNDSIPELGIKISLEGDIDEASWVRDASIDAIAEIGSTNPELIHDCIPILKELSKRSKVEYTRKKAKQALEKIDEN